MAEADSGAGVVGKSSCESRQEVMSCEHDDEGWEDEQRSWEDSATESIESDNHCVDGGVFVYFPSGTSMPSFSKSEPSRNKISDE